MLLFFCLNFLSRQTVRLLLYGKQDHHAYFLKRTSDFILINTASPQKLSKFIACFQKIFHAKFRIYIHFF